MAEEIIPNLGSYWICPNCDKKELITVELNHAVDHWNFREKTYRCEQSQFQKDWNKAYRKSKQEEYDKRSRLLKWLKNSK